ncbi:MAG: hypothetical protein R3E03_05670 [Novosphingobium sp.]
MHGIGEQLDRAGKGRGRSRWVCGLGSGTALRSSFFTHGGRNLHILGNVDYHRAGAAGGADKRFLDNPRQFEAQSPPEKACAVAVMPTARLPERHPIRSAQWEPGLQLFTSGSESSGIGNAGNGIGGRPVPR